MQLELTRKIRKFRKKIRNIISKIYRVFILTKEAEAKSYYKSNERKSMLLILLENFMWGLKHFELNEYYYMYKFDRKKDPVNQNEYLSFPLFDKISRKKNKGIKLNAVFLNYRCILRDKFVFSNFVRGLDIPTPKVIALYTKDCLEWIESGKKQSIEEITINNNLDVFCKPLTGQMGKDVFELRISDKKIYINGKLSSISELKNTVAKEFFLQERIEQHKKMQLLNPTSVNTLRIATFNINGEIKLFNAILKIGASGGVCDNWHYGGVVVGIYLDTGELLKYGVYPSPYREYIAKHPDAEIAFENFQIPFFEEAIDMAKNLHSKLYGIYTVGWDIAITKMGPVVIEGNDNWDFRMFQAYYGGAKKKLLELFGK